MPVLTASQEMLISSALCASRLVSLGADSTARLTLSPKSATNRFESFAHDKGMQNLSCRQLLSLAGPHGKQVLTAIDVFTSNPLSCSCRCGSRLAWTACHSHLALCGDTPSYNAGQGGGWRYSPGARCPCKKTTMTKKTYGECCWNGDSKPCYQNDKTGGLFGTLKIALSPQDRAAFMLAREQARATGNLNSPIFPNISATVSSVAHSISTQGFDLIKKTVPEFKPRASWDKRVYASIYGGLGLKAFFLDDRHWHINEAELKQRVKEWNAGLVQYCDDKKLEGDERETTIKAHWASELAPCGNDDCNVVETKIKDFERCGRCKRISYCSSDCQSKHWSKHKKHCIAR